MLLPTIETPADLRGLSEEQLVELAAEIRSFIVSTVTTTGGHLGSNLGVVELTLALHRVFDSPKDVLLFDVGHQAYVHKLITGRRYGFKELRQPGGLSGYPNRAESEHDWIENSHASPALSYAHGLATAFELNGQGARKGLNRRVVAVIGDGALTGGMAYEALNNLGHSGRRCLIVLNDNGRSYAPTVSHLSQSLTSLRINPTYVHTRERVRNLLREIPKVGDYAYSGVSGLTNAIREAVVPRTFFEALGVRYVGPIDGHDFSQLEQALRGAADWDGPIVLHVLTQKGRGYAPAEDDQLHHLHDFKVTTRARDEDEAAPPSTIAPTYTDAFSKAMVAAAERDQRVVALTAAMCGPTGLLAFQSRFPDRCFDVGIAEQHEVTAAAGMALGGLRPVVAVYSTFFTRAFDQANLDVGLLKLPVVMAFDRAGVTGDDGASHNGVLDLALSLMIPGCTVFAPSSAEEIPVMLDTALSLDGPSTIRYPKTSARHVDPLDVGQGLQARLVHQGDGSVCLLGVGKMLAACEEAAELLAREGITATVYDVRVVAPADPEMLDAAAHHRIVVTAEDGIRIGGAGSHLLDGVSQAARAAGVSVPMAVCLGTPKAFLTHGRPDEILARLGLDGPGIAESVRNALSGSPVTVTPAANLLH